MQETKDQRHSKNLIACLQHFKKGGTMQKLRNDFLPHKTRVFRVFPVEFTHKAVSNYVRRKANITYTIYL